MVLDELRSEGRLLADLYALAIEMDRARFGSITFLAAGERIRLKGDYKYNNKLKYSFNDSTELGRGGSGGCSHEWWHKFDEKKENKNKTEPNQNRYKSKPKKENHTKPNNEP